MQDNSSHNTLNPPFFSIIMPVYNREALLHHSIGSVINQDYKAFELICIDDGSTDKSLQVLQEYTSKDARIKYIELKENKGRCIARNTGILNAKAAWICFLDSDDVYYYNHLSVMKQLIQDNPEEKIFAAGQSIDGVPRTSDQPARFLKGNAYWTLQDAHYTNPIQLNQVCYNRLKIPVLFPDERIPLFEDWLFIKMLLLNNNLLKVKQITSDINNHNDRSMNQVDCKTSVFWKHYTGFYFSELIKDNSRLKNKSEAITLLFCANMLLTDRKKRESLKYLTKAMSYRQSYYSLLFYKALFKVIAW